MGVVYMGIFLFIIFDQVILSNWVVGFRIKHFSYVCWGRGV